MTFINPYEALALPPDATAEQIKATYRLLAKRYHPDSASNAGHPAVLGMFQQVTEAYDLLSDPDKRRKYDAIRKLLDAKTPDVDDQILGNVGPFRGPLSGSMGSFSFGSMHGFAASSMFFVSNQTVAPKPIITNKTVTSSGNGQITHVSVQLLFSAQMMRTANFNPMGAYAPGMAYVENGLPVGIITRASSSLNLNGDLVLDLEVLVQVSVTLRSQP